MLPGQLFQYIDQTNKGGNENVTHWSNEPNAAFNYIVENLGGPGHPIILKNNLWVILVKQSMFLKIVRYHNYLSLQNRNVKQYPRKKKIEEKTCLDTRPLVTSKCCSLYQMSGER